MMIFDGHSDLWEDVDEKRSRGLRGIIRHGHYPKWQAGGIVGGFYPIWINPDTGEPPHRQAEHIIDNMLKELEESADLVKAVTDAPSYRAALAEGKHAIFLGAEGLSFLSSAEELEKLYSLGFRAAGLTWNENNLFAAGAGGESGLSSAGRDCVKKMGSLGMLLDLAHSSKKSFWEALELSSGPVAVSHGGCAAICPAERNLSDEQIKAVASTNGVVGIYAYPPFLSDNEAEWNISQFTRHVCHVAELAGTEHVALGFDLVDFLDDAETDPEISCCLTGFEHIGKAPSIIAALAKAGFNEEELRLIAHDNFMRLIETVL